MTKTVVTPNTRYRPGDRIGGLYLVHQALKGGMGEVYLCLDEEHRIPVALKTFQARFLTNLKLRDAFKTEVATWIALGEHPNIVRCLFMDNLDSLPFMHLEWVPGEETSGNDLRDWLNQKPLSPGQALQFTIDVCNGLIHAGERQPGIVHRDLKPENILIAFSRIARITDWGLAKLVQQTSLHVPAGDEEVGARRSLVQTGGIVGTPAYMAPEQWTNGELDARTDIYGLGCVLYEMLTGGSPYKGTTLDEFSRKHLTAPVPRLPTLDEFHEQLNQLLARCLAKRIDERFSTARDLLEETSRLFEHQFNQKPRILHGNEVTADQLANRGATYHNLGLYQDALADFTGAIPLDPNNGKIYTLLGNTYFRLGRFDEALAEHNRAIELDQLDFKAYSNRGNTLAEMGRGEEAIEDFTRAIQLGPDWTLPLSNRGLTFTQMDRHEEALADFGRAIEISPREASTYFNRGGTYLQMKHFEEALDDVSRAIQIDPGFPKAYVLRAKVYMALHRFDEAQADLKQALHFDPKDVKVYLILGAMLLTEGSGSELDQVLQQAVLHCGRQVIIQRVGELVQGRENDPNAWESSGLFLVSIEAFEEAIEFFDKAILLDPQSISPLQNKGTALHKLKRYDESIRCDDQIIAMRPDYVLAWHNKGNTLGMTGRFREAAESFEQALRLDPTHGPSRQGLMRAMALLRRQSPNSPEAPVDPLVQQDSSSSACPRCGLALPLEQFDAYRRMGIDGVRLQCPRCSTILKVDFESGTTTAE